MYEIVFDVTPFAGDSVVETLTNVLNYASHTTSLVFKKESALYSDMYSERCNRSVFANMNMKW
jgi:hypothetical protein